MLQAIQILNERAGAHGVGRLDSWRTGSSGSRAGRSTKRLARSP